MKYLCWCIGFLFFAGCRPEKTGFLPVIDPSDFHEVSAFYLSEITDSVFFIPLDNHKFLAPKVKGILTDSCYFYAEGQQGTLRCYDLQGNFVRQYGSRGHGPGEYVWINHVGVTETGCVYVYDNSKNVVLKYAKNGEWAGDINLNIPSQRSLCFSDFTYLNGRFFFKGNLSNECVSDYLWVITDTSGHLVKFKLRPDQAEIYSGASDFFSLEKGIGYWDAIYDTIRFIQESGEEEAIYIWKPERFRDRTLRMLEYNVLPGGNVFALFWMGKKDRLRYLYYDRKQNKWMYMRHVEDDLTGYVYDRKKRIFFFKRIHYTSSGAYFTVSVSPFELKQWAKSDNFHRIRVKTPRFKQQLKELADNLEEEDNWVIVVYRLKE